MQALELENVVESIVFVAEQPVSARLIHSLLAQMYKRASNTEASEGEEDKNKYEIPNWEINEYSELPKLEQIENTLQELTRKYQSGRYPFEIRHLAEGYQFYTKRSYYPFVKHAVLDRNQKRLSRVALEALSIIAYRQPITKAEVEFIRGVNSDYAIQKLLDKKLVSIVGRSDAPGRPLLYGTSPFFMQYFGLANLSDLPKLKEFEESAETHLHLFKQHLEAQEEQSNGQETTEEKQ